MTAMLAAVLLFFTFIALIVGVIALFVWMVRSFLVSCTQVGMSIGEEAGRRHAAKMARRSAHTRW